MVTRQVTGTNTNSNKNLISSYMQVSTSKKELEELKNHSSKYDVDTSFQIFTNDLPNQHLCLPKAFYMEQVTYREPRLFRLPRAEGILPLNLLLLRSLYSQQELVNTCKTGVSSKSSSIIFESSVVLWVVILRKKLTLCGPYMSSRCSRFEIEEGSCPLKQLLDKFLHKDQHKRRMKKRIYRARIWPRSHLSVA